MAQGDSTLIYAVRPRVIGHYLAQLSLMLALLVMVPFGVALVYGEAGFAWRYAVVIGGLLLVATLARWLRAPETIQANEGIVVVCLAFVLAPLIMTVPMTAGGLPPVDALFEAVSAVTTTGLSTVADIESRSPVFAFARAWMQWYGGLGIAVLSVALLLGHHAAARRLAEPTETDNLATTARSQARQVLRVYVLLTLLGTLLLWWALGDGLAALTHMLATLSTGGFSSFDGGLAAMPESGAWVVTAFSVLGAVPLLLYHYAAAGRPAELWRDPELRALIAAVLIVAALLSLSLHHFRGFDWPGALRQGLMLGSSAQTTTGFAALEVGELDPLSKLLLVFSMLVGGGTGSTAGGFKLLRLLIALRVLQYAVQRTAMPPHAVARRRLAGRRLSAADIERAALVIGLFLAVTALSWLVFVAYGYPPLDALLEVASATGTVGLSTGISSAGLETPLKLLLCADMLLGRLEILALLVLLYPPTWLGRRA